MAVVVTPPPGVLSAAPARPLQRPPRGGRPGEVRPLAGLRGRSFSSPRPWKSPRGYGTRDGRRGAVCAATALTHPMSVRRRPLPTHRRPPEPGSSPQIGGDGRGSAARRCGVKPYLGCAKRCNPLRCNSQFR